MSISTYTGRQLSQPLVSMAAIGSGLIALAVAIITRPSGPVDPPEILLGGSLAASVVLTYLFPIYIRHNVKICVMSIPLYLMATMLHPAFAGLMGLVAIVVGELAVQRRRGTHGLDIITNAGRWTLLLVPAAAIAQISVPNAGPIVHDVLLLGAAVFLWAGDLLTVPALVVPITGEHPRRILQNTLQEGGKAEAGQYAMGFFGVLLTSYQIWALPMLVVPAILVYLAFKKELTRDAVQTLEVMADNVDARSEYTRGHSAAVAELVRGILAELGMHGQEALQIVTAARFHDIGKSQLPDSVLAKTGKLTPEEQTLIESYPDRGATLMMAYPDFARGIEMVRHHHEHWDGTGYPLRLHNTDIPFGARVIAVADAYDAMTHERAFRGALTPERAVELLRDGSGRQWDPHVVNAFLRSLTGSVIEETCTRRAIVPSVAIAPSMATEATA